VAAPDQERSPHLRHGPEAGSDGAIVGRDQSAVRTADEASSPANGSIGDETAAALLDLERSVGVLNSELIAATELISSLAEANNVLIHEVQVLRKWLLAVSGLSILGAILAAVAVVS